MSEVPSEYRRVAYVWEKRGSYRSGKEGMVSRP